MKNFFWVLAAMAVMITLPAYAEPQTNQVDLERIIVTNRRAPVILSSATEDVTVLSAAEIENLPARNLGEVLSHIPGVDIEPRQGFGRSTSVTIRGADSRQVRVMIDGIPLNNQASGQADPSQFPIENIERIEVIKGPSSSVWGSSLGGVINVITKDTGTTRVPSGKATSSFAEFRTRKQSAELSGKIESLGYFISSSYMESGGEAVRDDVLEKNAFGKLSYETEDSGKITGSFAYNGSLANSGEFPDGTWQSQPYKARYGKVSWHKDYFNAGVDVDLKHARQNIITETFLSVSDDIPFSRVTTEDILYQASLNSNFHLRTQDLLVLGTDFERHTLKSIHLSQTKAVTFGAPYINYTYVFDPLDFNFGLRFDHNSEFGNQLSPSFGALYKFNEPQETLIRLGVSRAFNAPPLLWKHFDLLLSGITTNPDIKPERAWVYELGFESKPLSQLWIKLSLYRADVKDAIAATTNGAGDFFMKNFQKFRRQGAQLQSHLNITKELNLVSSAAFNDIEDRSTKKTVRGGGKPRQSFNLGINYKNDKGLAFNLYGYYDRWNQAPAAEPNDRKMILDANISQRLKNVTLFLNLYNLTNSNYWADFFFPIPERYFEGGLTLNW